MRVCGVSLLYSFLCQKRTQNQHPKHRPPRGAGKAPRCVTASGRIRRPSAGYALPFGHSYRSGGYRLTPASRGFGHLRTVNASRNPAPSRDAAAGLTIGFVFCITPSQQHGNGFRHVEIGEQLGTCSWGLVFRFFVPREQPVTGRADGGIVGAQASGDARALRRPVGFTREAPKALVIG